MKKKILLSVLMLLFIAILVLKPIGYIKSFFDFDEADNIQIKFIKTSNTSVIRFLDEEEADEIYEELLKLKYYFRFQRGELYFNRGDNVYVGREEYAFKMFTSDREPYGFTLNENLLIIGTRTKIYTFLLMGHEDIYELFDELYDKEY